MISSGRRGRADGTPEFREWFRSLADQTLKQELSSVFDTLEGNPTAGDRVERDRWPDHPLYRNINNLFRIWVNKQARLTYTLVGDRNSRVIVVRVIEFFPSHKEYDRRFRYN